MKLPVNKLEVGMEVAKDVVRDDVVLLAAGARLTPQILRALAVWEIEIVHIADPKPADPFAKDAVETQGSVPAAPDYLEQAARTYTDNRFRHVPLDRPAVIRIRDIAAKRAFARLSQQSRPGHGAAS
jgi:hypothetical protein